MLLSQIANQCKAPVTINLRKIVELEGEVSHVEKEAEESKSKGDTKSKGKDKKGKGKDKKGKKDKSSKSSKKSKDKGKKEKKIEKFSAQLSEDEILSIQDHFKIREGIVYK